MKIAKARDAEVLVVFRIAVLTKAPEHFIEDELAQELGFLTRGKINGLDLAADVALFVGQEDTPNRLFIDNSCIKVHRCAGDGKGWP